MHFNCMCTLELLDKLLLVVVVGGWWLNVNLVIFFGPNLFLSNLSFGFGQESRILTIKIPFQEELNIFKILFFI